MTTLLLIRHGESEANRQKIFAGHLDVPLQNTGLRQAQTTAQYIIKNYKVDKVYASDLKRAFDTGKCVADLIGTALVPNKNLREIYAGKWDGCKFDDLVNDFKEDYNIWLTDVGNSRCTDGESVAELSERIMSALTDIAQDNSDKTVVVATHATPIRAVQCLLSGLSLDSMKDIPWVSNASVTEISYDDGKWHLINAGYDDHLSGLKTELPANA